MNHKFKIFVASALIFLLRVPALISMEGIGVINDEFFKDKSTIVSIRQVIPHDNHYMAIVDGSNDVLSKTTSIKPFFERKWEYNDSDLTARENIICTVLCGSKVLSKNLLMDTKVPYSFVKEVEEKSGVLSLGMNIIVYMMKEYTRPDGSIFRHKLHDLYSLDLKELRVPGPDIFVCVKEWHIVSQWQKKKRHKRNIYSCEDVYHVTIKRAINVTGAEEDEVSRSLVLKELRYKGVSHEAPECGNFGGSFPPNSKILG